MPSYIQAMCGDIDVLMWTCADGSLEPALSQFLNCANVISTLTVHVHIS